MLQLKWCSNICDSWHVKPNVVHPMWKLELGLGLGLGLNSSSITTRFHPAKCCPGLVCFWPNSNLHIFGGINWSVFHDWGRTACSSNTNHSLDASGQHGWPLNGESPFSWSGRTPLVAAEPVIKESEAAAGGFERAHNVDTGGGVVFCLPPAPPRWTNSGLWGFYLTSWIVACIMWWLNVIWCHKWLNGC